MVASELAQFLFQDSKTCTGLYKQSLKLAKEYCDCLVLLIIKHMF